MSEDTMNEGVMTHDVTSADGALEAPRRVARHGRQRPTAAVPMDDGDAVLVDTRGEQINPLPTTMTVAQAIDDALGARLP